MEKINCLICSSDLSTHFISLKDRFNITDEKFSLVKCSCGFVYLNPRPDKKNIIKYYNSKKYDPHNKVGFSYRFIQKISFNWKFFIIKKLFKNKKISILDYGAGKGDFSSFLNKKKYNIDIYEPFLNNLNLNQNIKVYIDNKNIASSYKLITFWHSLEHVHDLKELFDITQKKLDKNGYLMIAVPNLNAVEKSYFNENWAPYDSPRHLYHFTYKSMNSLLNKHGFKIVDYKPMYQDTIYNIFLSLDGTSIFNYVKLCYYSIISIFKILFFNKKASSSILYICKRK